MRGVKDPDRRACDFSSSHSASTVFQTLPHSLCATKTPPLDQQSTKKKKKKNTSDTLTHCTQGHLTHTHTLKHKWAHVKPHVYMSMFDIKAQSLLHDSYICEWCLDGRIWAMNWGERHSTHVIFPALHEGPPVALKKKKKGSSAVIEILRSRHVSSIVERVWVT